MTTRSQSNNATGIFTSLIDTFFSVAVAYYFYYTLWQGNTLDLHIKIGEGGIEIPPESYPMILLASWAATRMINIAWGAGTDTSSTLAKIFFWEDIVESAAFTAFMAVTLTKVQNNPTYLIVFLAFLSLSVVYLFILLTQRFSKKEGGTITLTRSASSPAAPAGGADVIASDTAMKVPAILVFTHMQLPGGEPVEIPDTIQMTPMPRISSTTH